MYNKKPLSYLNSQSDSALITTRYTYQSATSVSLKSIPSQTYTHTQNNSSNKTIFYRHTFITNHPSFKLAFSFLSIIAFTPCRHDTISTCTASVTFSLKDLLRTKTYNAMVARDQPRYQQTLRAYSKRTQIKPSASNEFLMAAKSVIVGARRATFSIPASEIFERGAGEEVMEMR